MYIIDRSEMQNFYSVENVRLKLNKNSDMCVRLYGLEKR